MARRILVVAAMLALLSACGTRSSTSVTPTTGAAGIPAVAVSAKKDPRSIPVFETDITDRKYHSLGDISTTVSKWSVFDPDPTPAKVNEALQKQAAKLGADAVIMARYGTVGIGAFTWGKLEGNGRAIAFDN